MRRRILIRREALYMYGYAVCTGSLLLVTRKRVSRIYAFVQRRGTTQDQGAAACALSDADLAEVLAGKIPVGQSPEAFHVFRTQVAVVDVVGVFPEVHREHGFHGRIGQRRAGVGS